MILFSLATGLCHAEQTLFVANNGSNSISAINSSGTVSPFAVSPLFDAPNGVVFDAAGNLLVTNIGSSNNTVERVAPGGTVSNFVPTSAGLDFPVEIAINSAGTFFVSNRGLNTISQITSTGMVSTFVNSGLDSPRGLAFDAQNNLYVANQGAHTISRITPDGTVSVFVDAGLDLPNGLTFDSIGNLYVSDLGTFSILKITPAGAVSTYAQREGFGSPTDLAFDMSGNLYVSIWDLGNIWKIGPGGTSINTEWATGLSTPWGLAFSSIPEPSTCALFGLGALALLGLRRRKST